MRFVRRLAWLLLPVVLLVAVWSVAIRISPRASMFMGSPSGTAQAINRQVAEGTFFGDMAITAAEAFIGWCGGAVLGIVFGLLLWRARSVANVVEPYFLLFGALPAFALGPVLIFWFGTGLLSKIALSGSATFVVTTMQAYGGSKRVDPRLIAMARAFGATDWQVLARVITPASAMWIIAGLQTSVGMALLGAVVGEFIASSRGLGHAVIVAEGLFDMNGIWAGVVGIAAIAALMQVAILAIQRRFGAHENSW